MSQEKADRLTRIAGLPLDAIGDEFISVADMQRRIMPDPERLERFENYDIFGKTIPASLVGGDYFDFIDLDKRFNLKNKMSVVIADASGHGLTSAMLIRDFNTALYTAISFQSHYEKDTTPFLFTKINRRMFRSSQPNQFISCFYGELHRNGTLRYINAGHYPPIVLKRHETIELDVGGTVLGAFWKPPQPYEVGEILLEEGDVLVAVTDGIVEGVRENGEEYGLSRLVDVVKAGRHLPTRDLFEAVITDVDQFTAGLRQSDDRTIVLIKRKKAGPAAELPSEE